VVVLITGCGSGFGKRAAITAAERGHTVYAGLRSMESAENLADPVGDLRVLPLDVTSKRQRDAAVKHVLERSGRIDAVVNNAGISLGGFLEDLDEDEVRHLFDVNVFGAWALTKACLPAMREQGSGTVVMVSSVAGRMALPGLGAYAGSKFALEGLSEAWRHELAPFGIRVVLIEPGPYKTDIFGRNLRLGRHASNPDSPYAASIARLKSLTEKVGARASDPQEVADRICDVIDAPRTRLRHPMGPGTRTRLILKRLAPDAAIEALIARIMSR